jgi:hypothetical protein
MTYGAELALLALRTWICSPMVRAASWTSRNVASVFGASAGLTSGSLGILSKTNVAQSETDSIDGCETFRPFPQLPVPQEEIPCYGAPDFHPIHLQHIDIPNQSRRSETKSARKMKSFPVIFAALREKWHARRP